MKKTRYVKPEVVVRLVNLPPMLFNASQQLRDDTIKFAPENETTIDDESDFI
ncbi:MAG: hypothetical protein J6W24_02390 [Prevotella sp.]|nr:hypothetical protein [Prevotella sp.]